MQNNIYKSRLKIAESESK